MPIPSSAVPDGDVPPIVEGDTQFAAYKLPAGTLGQLQSWYATRLPWHKDWNDWKWCGRGSELSNSYGSQTRTYTRREQLTSAALRIHLYKLKHRPAGISIDHISHTVCSDYFKVYG